MKLSFLLKGFPGHPLHPPLTDATIGAYTAAAAFAVLGKLGISEHNMATAWWLALIVGLAVTVPTALAGFADWMDISRETPLWRTATAHMLAMLTATAFFLLAAGTGHGGYSDGDVNGSGLVLTLVGWIVLTVGGWLGGSIVFVHGMRVLNLLDEPARRAVTPGGEEKERAE
ncbi:MAG: DUF2231 domain-containing protein [Gaiellaceae bacterium]